MQDTELFVRLALCFTSRFFHISTKNSYPGSSGAIVLVCGQNIICNCFNLTFLKEHYYVQKIDLSDFFCFVAGAD